jgi:CheY-like chemotaxis protein
VFNLRAVVGEVLDLFSVKIREKNLDIRCTIAPEVPALVFGDAHKLRQVLANLVGNAVKFTDSGGVDLGVRIERTDTGPAFIRVSVKDTGIGIPPGKAEAIFKAFTQADSSMNRKYGGTGLGLAISKRLVQLMGGDIWVEKDYDSGAAFGFNVALKPAGEFHTAQMDQDDGVTAEYVPYPLNILIAEDHEINLKVMQRILHYRGHSADIATNGLEVVEKAQRKAYDIIFMDIHMPEMDGLEATRQILAKAGGGERPYIVAMTADVLPANRNQCYAAGMDDFVEKPVKIERVREIIDWFAAQKGMLPDKMA